jgi:hypothetical protein
MLTVITAIYSAQRVPVRDPITKKIVKRQVSDSDFEDADRTLVIVYAGNNRTLPDWNS